MFLAYVKNPPTAFSMFRASPNMDDRAASTTLISDGVDRVTPLEGRGDSLCPFYRENPFFDFLSSLCLHLSLNVSQPESEGDREREREICGLLGESH